MTLFASLELVRIKTRRPSGFSKPTCSTPPIVPVDSNRLARALDVPREMRKCPVLPASADFFRLRIHGHQPSAGERPDIRTPFLVQRQIPSRDAAAPVAQHLRVGSSPLGPVARVIGSRVVGSAFRPVKLHSEEMRREPCSSFPACPRIRETQPSCKTCADPDPPVHRLPGPTGCSCDPESRSSLSSRSSAARDRGGFSRMRSRIPAATSRRACAHPDRYRLRSAP